MRRGGSTISRRSSEDPRAHRPRDINDLVARGLALLAGHLKINRITVDTILTEALPRFSGARSN